MVQAVLDLPVPTPQLFEPRGIGLLGRQAGQRVRPLLAGRARLGTADILDFPVDAADLRQTCASPVQPAMVPASPSSASRRSRWTRYGTTSVEHSSVRRSSRSPFLAVAVPVADHYPLPRRPRIGKAQRHRLKCQRLILLQDDEIVPPFRTSWRHKARVASNASPVITRPASSRPGSAARTACTPANSCPLPTVSASASTTRVRWA